MDAMAFRRALLCWYDREKRELPWRGTREPYRVWLSEIMLQQTRAEAVAPRYEEFLARFPTVEAVSYTHLERSPPAFPPVFPPVLPPVLPPPVFPPDELPSTQIGHGNLPTARAMAR